MGGVWLCKQPSLPEGLDNVSSDEDETDSKISDTRTDLVTSQSQQRLDLQLDVSDPSKFEECGETDVFANEISENNDDDYNVSSSDSEEKPRTSNSEPPKWLARAISICSEGEDLEILASEADTDEYSSEMYFPRAFSEYEGQAGEDCGARDGGQTSGSGNIEGSLGNEERTGTLENAAKVAGLRTDGSEPLNESRKHSPCSSANKLSPSTGTTEFQADESSSALLSTSNERFQPSDADSAPSVGSPQGSCSSSSKKTLPSEKRWDYDLSLICVDATEQDYLYAAARIIQKALDCEVEGFYEEAFSLYKSCVGLLLSGVQGRYSC